MKRISLVLIAILFPLYIFAQVDLKARKQVYYDEFMIVNDAFTSILDSILVAELDREYFKYDTKFNIWFIPNSESITLIQIQAIGNRVFQTNTELGCLDFRNHQFLISGKSVCEDILKLTGEKLKFEYAISQTQTLSDGTLFIDGLYGDKYTVWIYLYSDGMFQLMAYGRPNDPNSFNILDMISE